MSRPLILMYHRVADEAVDHWGLAVSPANFSEQLDVLSRTRRAMPLTEFVDQLIDNRLPADAVALTFDDGYVDNLTAGLPRLAAAGVPATVFLATGYLDQAGPFWWDELANFILTSEGPERFEIRMGGEAKAFNLSKNLQAGDDGAPDDALSTRRHVLNTVHEALRRLEEKPRQAAMAELRLIFARDRARERSDRPMTRVEVKTLVSDGLVTVGAHTVTHPVMSGIEPAACEYEVTASKQACEAIVGTPVSAFCYPFGDFNAAVREAVRRAGFASACSTQRGAALQTSDTFALPRIYIPNVDGDAFGQRIRWASGDT